MGIVVFIFNPGLQPGLLNIALSGLVVHFDHFGPEVFVYLWLRATLLS
jgi:hypothetical protein